jgi:putative tryptophan/tyrosine transport system substrate-binding protein
MRRREFIVSALGALAGWPRSGLAQGAAKLPVIGFLNGASLAEYERILDAFRAGLKETGYSEGGNVRIEYRWAEGDYRQLPKLTADLVGMHVDVIAATTTPANTFAVAATKTIPIVFTTSSDPVELGLVSNLNHPGGNATGAVTLNVETVAKRLEILHRTIPAATAITVLRNPKRPGAAGQARELQEAAKQLGLQADVADASTEHDIDDAFANAAKDHGSRAMIVTTDAFFFSRRAQLVALQERLAVPAIFDRREFADAGGLLSYGSNVSDVYRMAGNYIGKILGGTKPGDLPVYQSTKLELVINLKAAKAMGLTVPLAILATADEVIE